MGPGNDTTKFNPAIKVIFWLSVAFFIVLIAIIFLPVVTELPIDFLFTAIPGIIFLLLGIALIVVTVKSGLRGLLKKFLLITIYSCTPV